MILPQRGVTLVNRFPQGVALGWLVLAFFSPLCFESEQARAQAVSLLRTGGWGVFGAAVSV